MNAPIALWRKCKEKKANSMLHWFITLQVIIFAIIGLLQHTLTNHTQQRESQTHPVSDFTTDTQFQASRTPFTSSIIFCSKHSPQFDSSQFDRPTPTAPTGCKRQLITLVKRHHTTSIKKRASTRNSNNFSPTMLLYFFSFFFFFRSFFFFFFSISLLVIPLTSSTPSRCTIFLLG